jgi:hypothetical protein
LHLDGNPTNVISFQSTSNFFRNARVSDNQEYQSTTHYLGSEFQFAPVPDFAYTLRMVYYYKPEDLSRSNSSNLFLATCPDLLLYAALGEAEPYLMNDERLQTWVLCIKEV